jgi:hypothetical protein
MSNLEHEYDKLKTHLAELERRHRELDIEIETRYNNITVSDEVRKKKTMKLWLKDEIYRINQTLERISAQ